MLLYSQTHYHSQKLWVNTPNRYYTLRCLQNVQWLLSHLVGILTSPVAKILLVQETTVMRTGLITHKESVSFTLNQTSHKFMTKIVQLIKKCLCYFCNLMFSSVQIIFSLMEVLFIFKPVLQST